MTEIPRQGRPDLDGQAPKASLYVDFAKIPVSEQTVIYVKSNESGKTIVINEDHDIYQYLLVLHEFIR